ncbi:Fatty acid-binding -like protein 6 [Trichinella patagoniensis]|uniref:Fatty acid-binding-like protein 6 n=1 Tax=Trichinella patagoniensis TaxID=990121 RepID=A0A0V0ZLF3_9BILA|nr:Fatty acid-binding -like protein 6 [Trichinella patagoniensis]
MSTRRRDRESGKEQAQSDGGRTGANPEADQPTPPGGDNSITSMIVFYFVYILGDEFEACLAFWYALFLKLFTKKLTLHKFDRNKVAMAEKFIGKYRFVSSENFDEFMKALGVNYLLRKIANAASPIVELSLDRDVWTLRNISTFRTLEVSFRLGEEVDEVTPDGRHVKTVFTYENGELKQVQKAVKPGEKDSIFIRKLEGDKLITTCICGNVTSIRVLQRIS